MDFTLSAYKQLISTLQSQGFFFQTFEEYIQNSKEKVVILRHDVDREPGNALKMARLEGEMGIKATYFFRTIPHTFKPEIIKEIAEMGHEIGYHYENLAEISKGEGVFLWKGRMIRMVGWKLLNMERGDRQEEIGMRKEERQESKEERAKRNEGKGKIKEEFRNELFELAIDDFRLNLEKLRKLYPVKTICMHGSPLSRWDNLNLKNTEHLINLIRSNQLPNKIMMNVHPHR